MKPSERRVFIAREPLDGKLGSGIGVSDRYELSDCRSPAPNSGSCQLRDSP